MAAFKFALLIGVWVVMQISVANSDPLRPTENFDYQRSQKYAGRNETKVDDMVKNDEKLQINESNPWYVPAWNCTKTVTIDANGKTNNFLNCGTRVTQFEKIKIKANNKGILQF